MQEWILHVLICKFSFLQIRDSNIYVYTEYVIILSNATIASLVTSFLRKQRKR